MTFSTGGLEPCSQMLAMGFSGVSALAGMPGAQLEGVLPKWNGARVCDPQQPGVPNGRRKFHGFSDC